MLEGLSSSTRYGVFWRADTGYVAEAAPAPNNMSSGSYYLIGWQSTSDDEGGYPSNPEPPPGWGGGGVEMPIMS